MFLEFVMHFSFLRMSAEMNSHFCLLILANQRYECKTSEPLHGRLANTAASQCSAVFLLSDERQLYSQSVGPVSNVPSSCFSLVYWNGLMLVRS